MSKIPGTAWRGDSTLLCDGMADGLHPFITQHSETVSRVLQACSWAVRPGAASFPSSQLDSCIWQTLTRLRLIDKVVCLGSDVVLP